MSCLQVRHAIVSGNETTSRPKLVVTSFQGRRSRGAFDGRETSPHQTFSKGSSSRISTPLRLRQVSRTGQANAYKSDSKNVLWMHLASAWHCTPRYEHEPLVQVVAGNDRSLLQSGQHVVQKLRCARDRGLRSVACRRRASNGIRMFFGGHGAAPAWLHNRARRSSRGLLSTELSVGRAGCAIQKPTDRANGRVPGSNDVHSAMGRQHRHQLLLAVGPVQARMERREGPDNPRLDHRFAEHALEFQRALSSGGWS
jgi:hypothetical protein